MQSAQYGEYGEHLALPQFVQLPFWATPQPLHVRSGSTASRVWHISQSAILAGVWSAYNRPFSARKKEDAGAAISAPLHARHGLGRHTVGAHDRLVVGVHRGYCLPRRVALTDTTGADAAGRDPARGQGSDENASMPSAGAFSAGPSPKITANQLAGKNLFRLIN